MKYKHLLFGYLIALVTLIGASLTAQGAPIRPGFDTEALARNDDGANAEAEIGFPVNIFGTLYHSVFVNNNGNLTFGNPFAEYTPQPLNDSDVKIIAAFWAHVDTTNLASGVTRYGKGTVDGRPAFGATWVDVGYFSSKADKLNTFQAIIVDRSDRNPGDFDVELRYSKIQWEVGQYEDKDATPGDGLGDSSSLVARVGFADVSNNFWLEMPGSGKSRALLDGGGPESLVVNDYYIEIKGGSVSLMQREITVEPENATGLIGATHTVIATLKDDPIDMRQVTFNVIAGPNQGVTETTFTDPNGQAFFTYPLSATPGTDQIVAEFVDSSQTTKTSNQVSNTIVDNTTPPIPQIPPESSQPTPAPVSPNPLAGNFLQISAGWNHSCGIKEDHTLSCWGDNSVNQTTSPPDTFRQVSAGRQFTCGVTTNGLVKCWGDNTFGQLNVPEPLKVLEGSASAVSAGGQHACAIKSDSTVVCWGDNTFGQLNPPSQETVSPVAVPLSETFSKISAGRRHTCGIKSDGTLSCWGGGVLATFPTPPQGTFVDVSSAWHHACAVASDGSLTCWGNDRYGEISPPQGLFAQVSIGGEEAFHACGLRQDNGLFCWGANTYEQATPPSGYFVQVSAGGHHTCGIKTDRTIACWGSNHAGQSKGYVEPTADFIVTPPHGLAPLTVAVNGGISFVPNGKINTYQWQTSDGQTASGATASFTFNTVGKYTITLTVTDDKNITAQKQVEVPVFLFYIPNQDEAYPKHNPLPDLGLGIAVDRNGSPVLTTTSYTGGISVNGGMFKKQKVVSPSDTVTLQGTLKVEPAHVGKVADLVVYADAGNGMFYMLDSQHLPQPWDDKNVAALVAFQSQVTLLAVHPVEIYKGSLPLPGTLLVYFGYRLEDGTVVTNGVPLAVTVKKK